MFKVLFTRFFQKRIKVLKLFIQLDIVLNERAETNEYILELELIVYLLYLYTAGVFHNLTLYNTFAEAANEFIDIGLGG